MNVQQTVHLLLPYDMANEVNSFLFYDSVTGKTRKHKAAICRLFGNVVLHYDETKDHSFHVKVPTVMRMFRKKLSGICRLTYSEKHDFELEETTTSLYLSIKEGGSRRELWCGFCNNCGDYAYLPQQYHIQEEPAREFYSPNTDVLCLCELEDVVVSFGQRRRPYPVGRVLY